MTDDDAQRGTDASRERDVREREEEARLRRTGAESERAAAERKAEEPGGEADRVSPADADEQRRGGTPSRSE
jgi:hypothetical protein